MKRIDRYKKRWNGEKYVRAHRLIAERALGKSLSPFVVIHHFNGGCDGPIVICQDQEYHLLLHTRKRAYAACGDSHQRKCFYCKEYDELKNLRIGNKSDRHVHPVCESRYKKLLYDSTENAPVCLCGCRERVRRNSNKSRNNNGWWNQYLHGHNSR